MRRFENKVAFVTGGAGAIGRTAAKRLGLEGAKLVILDKDVERASSVAEDIRKTTKAETLALAADVSVQEEVADAVEDSIGRFGGIDILFNNAGVNGLRAPVYQLAVAEWDDVIRINLRGQFVVLQQVAKAMIKTKRGDAVINMSSSLAESDVHSGGAAYAASKHGVLGLTRAAAVDLARFGIRVNAICPGIVETSLSIPAKDSKERQADIDYRVKRIPLGRLSQPADIAGLVMFLASSDAVNITGTHFLIDGGQTIQSWSNAPRDGAYPRGW